MDAPKFDHLSRSLAALGTRRSLLQALTGLPLLGGTLAVTGGAGAARKRRATPGGVRSETFHKRKVTYCLNGETIRRLRRKQNKLLAQGAVRGRCQACVANDGACGTGCCGSGFCAGGISPAACGSGGGACAVCGEGQSCIAGVCTEAACTPATCPTGCCQNGACEPGVSIDACGTGGEACELCGDPNICSETRICCLPVGAPCNLADPGACCSQTCFNGQPSPVCL